ncbi:MAG: hypothetical protein HY790_04130 [Deltaproteobacteria bacterium]|nr:hypothetical protein [Deltaproteobacteria bacterium]MBI4795018.1 hypothetical protein [Deltaproteobacteria bacterium]
MSNKVAYVPQVMGLEAWSRAVMQARRKSPLMLFMDGKLRVPVMDEKANRKMTYSDNR